MYQLVAAHATSPRNVDNSLETESRAGPTAAPEGRTDDGDPCSGFASLPARERLSDTGPFRRHWPSCERCGYDVFRRAVRERDQRAWDLIVAQYRGLVLAWMTRQPGFHSIRLTEDDDHWVDEVFRRFFSGVTSERFGKFPDVGRLCGYLRLCAISAVRDELRSRAGRVETCRIALGDPDDWFGDEGEAETVTAPTEQDSVSAREVLEAITGQLHDNRERDIFRLSFILGYTPREISRLLPDHFPSVEEVYQMKRKLLDRLRGSRELRDLLCPVS